MNEEFTVEGLYRHLSEEKKTGELLPLPENFYKEAAKYETSNETEDKRLIKENHNKLLNTLKSQRIQKILIYLAYGRPLPAPLPEEELRLHARLKAVLSEGQGAKGSGKVRILAEIPALMTPEGASIGPYKKGEVIEVAREADREFILKNKIGEIVE